MTYPCLTSELRNNTKMNCSLNSKSIKKNIFKNTKKKKSCYQKSSKNTQQDIDKEKYFCPYCYEFTNKFPRHLKTYHIDKKDVKKFCSLPELSSERLHIIKSLRILGYKRCKKSSKRRPKKLKFRTEHGKHSENRTTIDCKKCGLNFSKTNISKHSKKCKGMYKLSDDI